MLRTGGLVPAKDQAGDSASPEFGRMLASFHGDGSEPPQATLQVLPEAVRVRPRRPVRPLVVASPPRRPVVPARKHRARAAQHVRLADIRIAWQSDGGLRGTATFDLEPGKAQECLLWLPDGFRLDPDCSGRRAAACRRRWRRTRGRCRWERSGVCSASKWFSTPIRANAPVRRPPAPPWKRKLPRRESSPRPRLLVGAGPSDGVSARRGLATCPLTRRAGPSPGLPR